MVLHHRLVRARDYLDWLDAGAIAFLVIANCTVFSIAHFKPHITTSGSLSEAGSRALTLASATLATLFSAFITARVRHLILRSFERDLQDLDYKDGLGITSSLDAMDSKWRGALGIDDFSEKTRLYNALYWLLFAICGLNTPALVTAFAPSLTTRSVDYEAIMAGGRVPVLQSTSLGNPPCAGKASADLISENTAYTWSYDDGESVFFAMNSAECPVANVLNKLPSINFNTSDYVYLNSGTAVKKSAIGASIWTHSGDAFDQLQRKYGRNLVKTRQCVPIMTSNPVQCRRRGTITPASSNVVTLETGHDESGVWDAEQFNASFPARDIGRDSIMANWQWLKPNATLPDGSDAIGLSLIGFGAWDATDTAYTSVLASAMNDPMAQNLTSDTAVNSTYVVTCTLDARNVFNYRTVTLDMQAIQEGIGTNFAYYLSGGEPCVPDDEVVNDVYFATAARASQAAVLENSGVSGYVATILSAAGTNRAGPYAFANSNNALEDVLGLAVGIAVANLPLDDTFVRTASSSAEVQAERLGSDSGVFYLLVVPPLLSFVILTCLAAQSIQERWRPGAGGCNAGVPREVGKHDRYAAESLVQLVGLGSRDAQRYEE